jgi:hypothetical protein
MGIRTRLIAAAMAAAATVAVAGAATASALPTSPTTSAPSDNKKPGGDKKPDDDAAFAKVAASLHVTVKQLTTALRNMKQAVANGTDMTAAVAAFAKELRISVAQAEQALKQLSRDNGKPKPDKEQGVPEAAVKLLATELHISVDRSRQVFRDLDKVKARGDDIVKDPAFVAIAKGLGITPQKLLDTLRKVKQQIGDKPKEKAESGTPAK